MIFDGLQFRRSRRVVMLPREYNEGEAKNYVAFGRTCTKNTLDAIRTNAKWRYGTPYNDEPENGEFPVYATKIESDGYSLTRLMYGKDGYMYLADGGQVYVRKAKKR